MGYAILLTGGTGTFGRAAVPALLSRPNVTRIVILSRDELKQAEMEQECRAVPGADRLRFYLGDVRDRARLEMAMRGCRYIIHAAALKRVEKCERDPIEAFRTNVEGTANVIHAALAAGATNVIGLSTDKAVNPVNLYGATKLTMERLLIAANNISGGSTRFGVVRYGNIFGSRGSVVRTWQRLRQEGCEIAPVTDPDATRFLMRIGTAVELVLDSLFNAWLAPLKVSPFVPAFRLGDLAEAMGFSGTETIGMPEHEKVHEELMPGWRSDTARRLTVEELRKELALL